MQSAGAESVRTCTPLLSQAGRVGFGNGVLLGGGWGEPSLVRDALAKRGQENKAASERVLSQVWELLLSLGTRSREPRPSWSKRVTPGSGLFAVLPLLMILPQHLLGLVLLLLILAAPCGAGRAIGAQGCSSARDGNQSSAPTMWNSVENNLLLAFGFAPSLFQV